ncbi:alanine racemase [Ornithinimicrobium cryptoxanthini]|uniref:Alanine racemase n=1 Tax=Ornithinimicrobium cryptoxanthini TaxID=2934161 RepID=A0ABY4YI74_9MICO|nr:alanine racemase [Ornithinimicrobium cryptoxanthini]USQ76221.1 alanine racemase [Ornithinimicrobium cryptoxanthini]
MESWDEATAGLTAPLSVVDLDAFDANAADLVRRAGGTPIRVASKSLRVRSLIQAALDKPGFAGVMAYAVREALWLARPSAGAGAGTAGAGAARAQTGDAGIEDVFVAYPTVDTAAVREITADPVVASRITLTIDSMEHLDLLASAAGEHPLRVALDVDSSLRFGRGRLTAHLGVRRSYLRDPGEVASLARAARDRGLTVVGLMFYDAQIAGLPDSSPAVRWVKRRSAEELLVRRAAVVAAAREVTELEFVNGGGTGSLHVTGADPVVTELAAGSGLLGPTLFDGYRSFTPSHAAAYAIPVVRRPGPGFVTGFSGGYIASGPPGRSRVPSVLHPRGLKLLRAEGAGEVQTPVHGDAANAVALGDRIWLRHAKSGELFERFDTVHLVRGAELVESVPTYRGEGQNFG